jgi:phosphoribosylformimino-5-aminoimidazole carboxamide ribotide isomerase
VIAIPAVDIRSGACVQLVGGSYEHEVVRLADPVAVATQWVQFGFQSLHVVDLDAATHRGSNAPLVRAILSHVPCETHVGGGVRSADQIVDLLGRGAAHVIVGSRAIEDPAWLEGVASRFPGRLLVAVDVQQRNVLVRGWTVRLALDITEALAAIRSVPLGGILVTAVHREGQRQGPDVGLMELVVARATVNVYAAGGIAAVAHLRALADRGIHGAVIGTALYTGELDPYAVAAAFPRC